MGFAVPLAAWFRGPLEGRIRAILGGPRLAETGLFEPRALTALLDEHRAGTADRSGVLWTVLMFESFLRRVHDANPAAATTLGAA
jgi:asparagine synthase (glutamine-hydrolysing)